jgi:hypothetical protein
MLFTSAVIAVAMLLAIFRSVFLGQAGFDDTTHSLASVSRGFALLLSGLPCAAPDLPEAG